MHPASRILLAAATGVCLTACTVATEAETQALGTALAALPKGPTKKPTRYRPPVPAPKDLVCADKPDLAIQPLTADNHRVKGWLYVCAPVKNSGGIAWSESHGFTVWFSSNRSSTSSPRATGVSSLGKGQVNNRCAWMKVPDLLRMGHDTPQWGECRTTINVSARLAYGPDYALDSKKSNDDCRSGNNNKTTTFSYMASCPW